MHIFGLKECQLAFMERCTYGRQIYIHILYMKNPPFISLVWGSLRLAPISMSQTWLYNNSQRSYQIFTTTSQYRRYLAIVRHNTNFATVHSRVIIGSCSMEFEYNFLRNTPRVIRTLSIIYTIVCSLNT